MSWKPPIALADLPQVNPTVRPWAQAILTPPAWALFRVPRRVHFELEGLEYAREPALLAMNHTHYIDWLPVRWTLQQQGRSLSSFAKPRPYQGRAMAAFLHATGNIPLSSRGYVISADFRCVLDRSPTEEEYRTLRDLVDGKASPPDAPGPDLERLFQTPRTVLGRAFQPARESYAQMINAVFCDMAHGAIGLAKKALEQGSSLIIAPQGVFTSRLTKGRPGGVQFAHALGLPMVPVGLSGMLEVFPNQGFRNVGGTLTLRVGPPVDIQLPSDHVAFEYASEDRNRVALESETQRLMEAINGLLTPGYQWDENPDGDGISGVARFMD